ncbi:MAG TPA: hypothetical protein VGL13_06045, partial [Polyangiaceae bacterium]
MTDETRAKRPPLDRDRPNRTWDQLFRAAGVPQESGSAGPSPNSFFPGNNASVADAVDRGYRVINEYMRQAQSLARGMGPQQGAKAGPPVGMPPDMHQMSQRLMQYGWDFAGLWFEMWSRMSNASGSPTPTS